MSNRERLLGSVLFTLAAFLAVASAARAQVEDRAGLFTRDAVRQADRRIANLKIPSGKQLGLILDTFKESPETKSVPALSRDQWVQKRLEDTKSDSVYVLI